MKKSRLKNIQGEYTAIRQCAQTKKKKATTKKKHEITLIYQEI